MERPSISQYQLSEQQYQHWKHWEDVTLWAWTKRVSFSIWFLFAFLGYRDDGLGFALVNAVIIGTPLVFFSAFFMGVAAPSVLSWVRPGLKRYLSYKTATERYSAWELQTQAAYWRSLSGRAFEAALAQLFRRAGYEVSLTPVTGDKGIDLEIRRGNRRIIVQCKATQRPIGPAVVRELYGTLSACNADLAILASVGGVTVGVRQFAEGKPIAIVTLTEILSFHHGQDPVKVHDINRRLSAAS
jgi:Restriction endonuclease